jgi:hypothetical protein
VEACGLAAVAEGIAVARANGVKLTWAEPRGPWEKARAGLPPEFRTSMLREGHRARHGAGSRRRVTVARSRPG